MDYILSIPLLLQYWIYFGSVHGVYDTATCSMPTMSLHNQNVHLHLWKALVDYTATVRGDPPPPPPPHQKPTAFCEFQLTGTSSFKSDQVLSCLCGSDLAGTDSSHHWLYLPRQKKGNSFYAHCATTVVSERTYLGRWEWGEVGVGAPSVIADS